MLKIRKKGGFVETLISNCTEKSEHRSAGAEAILKKNSNIDRLGVKGKGC